VTTLPHHVALIARAICQHAKDITVLIAAEISVGHYRGRDIGHIHGTCSGHETNETKWVLLIVLIYDLKLEDKVVPY